MAEIKDCIGKHVKISKNSITIKNEEGKTCGVVRNISSLADIHPNKQMVCFKQKLQPMRILLQRLRRQKRMDMSTLPNTP